jgi:PTS system nitrogen regulatory IIA component
MDGELVRLVILVIAGENQHRDYLKLLSHIMSILKKEDIKEKIIAAGNSEVVLEILSAEEHKV